MHQLYCVKQISSYKRSCLLGYGGTVGDDVEELPIATQFHQNVDVGLIVEITEHFDDIRVVQETLDFKLADELDHEVVFDYTFLLDHLHAQEISSEDVLGQVNASELSFSDFFNYFKILFTQSFTFIHTLFQSFTLVP